MRFAIVLDSRTVFFFLVFLTLPLGLGLLQYPPFQHALLQTLLKFAPIIIIPIVFTVVLYWKNPEIDGNLFMPILVTAFVAALYVGDLLFPTAKPQPVVYPSCADHCPSTRY